MPMIWKEEVIIITFYIFVYYLDHFNDI